VQQVVSRPRAGYLLAAAVVGQVILISAQVQTKRGVPILQTAIFGAFSEVERRANAAVSFVRDSWSGYVDLRRVRVENEALKRELAATQVAVQEQRALADRARSLEKLLEFRERITLKTAAADVIAAAASPDFRTLTIDKGSSDGLTGDTAVISPAGVIGRVVLVSPRASKVQLLVDRNAAAGALIERSRAQGIVVGRGDNWLRMDYVSEVSDVVKGDAVVTSGIDGIYPKGFVIGQVESVEKIGVAYREIIVKPAVNFSSLEEVLVVMTPPAAAAAAVEESKR
jgi:rod shape-determining protein MreC